MLGDGGQVRIVARGRVEGAQTRLGAQQVLVDGVEKRADIGRRSADQQIHRRARTLKKESGSVR